MAITTNKRYSPYIDGDFVDASELEYFTTTDPATEETLAEVSAATPEHVDQAVQTARKALPAWQATAPTERGPVDHIGFE